MTGVGRGDCPWRRRGKGAKFFPPQLEPFQTKQKGEREGVPGPAQPPPAPGLPVLGWRQLQLCNRCWNHSTLGGPGPSVGASAARTGVGNGATRGAAGGQQGLAHRGAAAPQPHGVCRVGALWGRCCGSGAMLWVGGTVPSPGMLARCLGLAAHFANYSCRVLSLQLLGAATHWDLTAPRFGGPGAGPDSPPSPFPAKCSRERQRQGFLGHLLAISSFYYSWRRHMR